MTEEIVSEKIIRLGVIGLGAMGAELLQVAAAHAEVAVAAAADPSEQALQRVRAAYPELPVTSDAREVIASADIDAVYIASPPATHAGYAIAAMEAGKAVFCEKPLAIARAEGERMVAVAAATGMVNALNFTFSDRAAAVEVARAVRAGEAGDVVGVDIRLAFPAWPRAFQADAAWLAGRGQGGFLREVGSHFVFLTDRVLGPLELAHTQVAYGDAAEVAATAVLDAGGVPVRLSGQVAAGPETYEWTLYGTRRSYRITDWADLWIGDGADGWRKAELPGPRGTEETRLSEFVHAIRGGESTLADFAAGLRVQRVIEGCHGGW